MINGHNAQLQDILNTYSRGLKMPQSYSPFSQGPILSPHITKWKGQLVSREKDINYIILSTGRARSGVLASYLRKVGLGNVDQWYEKAHFDLYKCTDKKSTHNWLESKRKEGILGIKLVFSHIRRMNKSLGIGLKEFADTYFPDAYYIYHTRNPFYQAIESQLYQVGEGIISKPSLSAIKKRVGQVILTEAAYEDYFEKHEILPIRCNEYKLEHEHEKFVQYVLDRMKIDHTIKSGSIKSHFQDYLMNEERDKIYNDIFRGYQ